jgi:hypothetical protein
MFGTDTADLTGLFHLTIPSLSLHFPLPFSFQQIQDLIFASIFDWTTIGESNHQPPIRTDGRLINILGEGGFELLVALGESLSTGSRHHFVAAFKSSTIVERSPLPSAKLRDRNFGKRP